MFEASLAECTEIRAAAYVLYLQYLHAVCAHTSRTELLLCLTVKLNILFSDFFYFHLVAFFSQLCEKGKASVEILVAHNMTA